MNVTELTETSLMLLTYTEDGVRLSCAEFENSLSLQFVQESRVSTLV